MKLKYTVVINKSYENEQINTPPAYVLPPAAIAKGNSLPPIFGNNALTYYTPILIQYAPKGAEMNGLERLLCASSMKKV
jgi:hypothetical protein